MDSVNTTSDASKTLKSMESILSSLSTSFNSDDISSNLFNSFLSDQQALVTDAQTSKAAPTGAMTSSQNLQNNTTAASASSNTKDTTSVWRDFLEKLRERENAKHKAHSNHVAKIPTIASSDDSDNDSKDAASGTTVDPTQVIATTATTTATTQSDTNKNGQGSISDILANINATDATANAGSETADNAATKTQSDNTPIEDALCKVLALTKQIEKKLDLASTTTPQSVTTDAASSTQTTTPAVTPANTKDLTNVNEQLTNNLKSLANALQNTLAQNAQNNSANSNNATIAADMTPTAASQTSVTPLTDAPKAPLAMIADNFFNLLKSGTDNQFTAVSTDAVAAPITANGITAATGSKGDATLDMDMDADTSGNKTTAGNLAATIDTTAPTTTDNVKASNPYSFASQLSATRTSNGATGLPSAVEQVILQMNRNVKTGNDQMSIQLHPTDLGRINVKLDVGSDGKVSGTVVADNPDTLHLLLKDVRSLERALQEAGLRADPGSLQFSLSGQSGQSSGQAFNNTSSGQSSGSNNTSDEAATALALSASSDAAETYYLTPGRVNMKV